MRWFLDMGMRYKLLGLVAMMLLVVGGIFIWMFNQQVRQAARTESVERAACVVDMAESVRQGMAEKWTKGVFSQQQMKSWQEEGSEDKILAAVPIVSAWEAVMRRAEDGGYQFKTPRFNPRNPSNAPDAIESEALKLFAKDPTLQSHSLIDTEQNAVRYFRPIRLSSECMMCHGDPVTSMALWGNDEGLDATGYKMENLKVGDLHGAFEVIQSLDKSDANARAAVLSGTLVIVCFLVVCCGVLAFVLDRTLLKPLTAASNAFEKLVAGDLRSTLDVTSGDEVGRMQAGINTLVDRLKSLILQMRGSSDELTEVSDGLNGTASRVEGAVSETTSRSLTVSSSAEEMSVAMQDMGGSLKEVSGSIQTVAAATSQVSSNAESVAKCTQEASDVASKALELSADGSRRISEMEAAAEGIDNIVLVIQNLAEQTNLLALNATIESARAGEAGKGFAVVADEVKMLSQQTSDATSEIRKEVDQIQDLSRLVVASIASIKDAATEVNGKTEEIATAVNEQRGAIESVSDQISYIAKNTESISENVEQTVIASREVAEQIVGVSGIAEDTSKEVESTKSAGQNVERVSNQFTELLSGFKVD